MFQDSPSPPLPPLLQDAKFLIHLLSLLEPGILLLLLLLLLLLMLLLPGRTRAAPVLLSRESEGCLLFRGEAGLREVRNRGKWPIFDIERMGRS